MKKLLALIVALMMALSCTLALAEEGAAFPGITINAELDVDREAASQYLEMFGFQDDALATANGVVALLDSLRETTIITAEGLQYDLGLNDSSMLSLGGSLNEDGLVIVSSLIPSYALTVSMETISGLLETVMANMPTGDGELPFDVNALAAAVTGYVNPFIQTVSGAVTMGETEVGEFEYEGHRFNAKTTLDVDMKTIAEAVNTLMDQLNSDETVQTALQAMQGAGVNVETSDKNISLDPETAPTVDAAVYTYVDEAGNASDEVYVLVTVTPQEGDAGQTIVHTLVEGGDVTVTVELPAENTTVRFAKQEKEDGSGIALRADINMSGMYIAAALDISLADTIHCVLDTYFLSDVKPLATATLDIALSGELTMDVSGEGKEVIAVEALMSGDESASEAVSGLMMDLFMNGVLGTMGTITENVPELSDTLSSVMGSMMGM